MLLKFWGCITRMSDLITFSLSQLARALGSVPCPKRKMGSSLAQTGLHHFILYYQ